MAVNGNGRMRKPPATIKSIADALDVSPSTVSRALRQDKSVTARTTERVREAAERLGYRRDLRGVNLRTGKTNMLCAILASNPTAEFGDPATMHLIQGLIAGVEGSDQKLVIQPVAGERRQLDILMEAVEASRFDGIVLDHTSAADPRVQYLLDAGVPFVTFGRTQLSGSHAYFDVANGHAAEMATAELARRGHQRIGLIDPPPSFLFSAQRRAGYAKALAAAGMAFDPELIIETDINSVTVHEAVRTLSALENPATAYVTSNEVATIAAVHACRELGLDLGALDFVSRDGTRFFDYSEPAVSSCYYPIFDAGQQLIELLMKAIEGTPPGQLQTLRKTELIVR